MIQLLGEGYIKIKTIFAFCVISLASNSPALTMDVVIV